MTLPEKRQRTLVKICGVRTVEVAAQALQAGADAVGVVAVPGSPREVSPAEACRVAGADPLRTVLVLRDPDAERLELARNWAGPVQIHPPSPMPDRGHVQALAFHSISQLSPTPRQTAWLLDAPAAGAGEAWSWPRSHLLPTGLPVILAGGLTLQNVAHAIRHALPWAVDVSSGVERVRGTKDLELIRGFIDAVHACDRSDGRTQQPSPTGFEALR